MAQKNSQLRSGRRNSTAPIEIRPMELRDLPGVFELGQALFTAERLPTLYRAWYEDEVVQLYGTDADTCQVAECEDRIVGFALGSIMKNCAARGATAGSSGSGWRRASNAAGWLPACCRA